MNGKRKIEIFSAGCPLCQEVIEQVRQAACRSCDVQVLDLNAAAVKSRAAELGITSVPAVVIDGKLSQCCQGRSVNLDVLRSEGLGQPIR